MASESNLNPAPADGRNVPDPAQVAMDNKALERAMILYMLTSEECPDGFTSFMLNEVWGKNSKGRADRIRRACKAPDMDKLVGPDLRVILQRHGIVVPHTMSPGERAVPYSVEGYLAEASTRRMRSHLIMRFWQEYEMQRFKVLDEIKDTPLLNVDLLTYPGDPTASEQLQDQARSLLGPDGDDKIVRKVVDAILGPAGDATSASEMHSTTHSSAHGSKRSSTHGQRVEEAAEEAAVDEDYYMSLEGMAAAPKTNSTTRNPTHGSAHGSTHSSAQRGERPEQVVDEDYYLSLEGMAKPAEAQSEPAPSSTHPLASSFPMGKDWTVDSEYRGTIQPPLAVRLEQVLNFLRDEDKYRCSRWDKDFREVCCYLHWLACKDPAKQLQQASPETQAMFHDAVTKTIVHSRFDDHHSEPTPLEMYLKPAADVPRIKSTRLDWLVAGLDVPQQTRLAGVPGRESTLMPRMVHPWPATLKANRMFKHPRSKEIYEQFAKDELAWWGGSETAADHGAAQEGNLAEVESSTYDSIFKNKRVSRILEHSRGLLGNVIRRLPDGTPLQPGDPRSWAAERGAQRAGLQQALEKLQLPRYRSQDRLVLPADADTLQRARDEVLGLQWAAPRLNEDQVRSEPPIAPYSFFWSKHVRYLDDEARKSDEKDKQSQVQAQRKLLKRCRTVDKLLQQAMERWPRPLLKHVTDIIAQEKERASKGGDTHPRSDETMVASSQDLAWLKFLATECRNRAAPTGLSHIRKDYMLYRAFVKRVLKLLSDKSPDALFQTHSTSVTVPRLLDVINRGRDGGTTGTTMVVKRARFGPKEACYYLDRMADDKLVRFRLHPQVWGIVQRPAYDAFPEHRVRWPAAAAPRGREVPAFPEDVCPAESHGDDACREGEEQEQVVEGSRLWDFFSSMAVRMGRTLHMLERENDKPPRSSGDSNSNDNGNGNGGKGDSSSNNATSRTVLGGRQRRRGRHAKGARAQRESFLEAVIRPADPATFGQVTDMRDPDAAKLIRERITDELSGSVPHSNAAGPRTKLDDLDWSRASTAVRGASPQYWNLDRWPALHGPMPSDIFLWSGFQNKGAALKHGADPDPDPDPIPAFYQNLTPTPMRRYGADNGVRFRRGRPTYPIGDTPLQRKRVREYMTGEAERALGINRTDEPVAKKAKKSTTTSKSKSGFLSWSLGWAFTPSKTKTTTTTTVATMEEHEGPAKDNDDDDRSWLPPVDPKKVPKSWDPKAEMGPGGT